MPAGSALMLVNDIKSFDEAWTATFEQMVGPEFTPLLKHQVSCIAWTMPHICKNPAEGFAYATSMTLVFHECQGDVASVVWACFAELANLVLSEKCTPDDAADIMSRWWHGFRTIGAKQSMALQGITEEAAWAKQEEINSQMRAERAAKLAADGANKTKSGAFPVIAHKTKQASIISLSEFRDNVSKPGSNKPN